MCGVTSKSGDGLRLHPVCSPGNIDVVVNPAYALALHFHGLENLCADPATAIKCRSWGKITGDELLDEFFGFALYDELAKKIEQRYACRDDLIEVSIPIVD